MVVHKRADQWRGSPFLTLDEAAAFLEDVARKLKQSDGIAASANVSTGEQDYRNLTIDELRDLSGTIPMETVQSAAFSCGPIGGQGVHVQLILLGEGERRSTRLEVEGDDEVIVEGIFVGSQKRLGSQIENVRYESARKIEADAVAGERPHEPLNQPPGRLEPWLVQLIGGTTAAVVAGVIVYVIVH
jgi:hypothetical protein